MARLKRCIPAGIPQHIIQRGNNRQACFASAKDFAAYAHWLYEASSKYGVLIHAWVFMSNHVHLLATPTEQNSLSKMFQFLGRHYVRYFNYQHQRTGALWEGRFKSCLVQEERYFLVCQRYIELNPVRARMVDDPSKYVWSSYQANALGVETKLIYPHPVYLALGTTRQERLLHYRSLFEQHIDGELLTKIRQTLNKGLILGTDTFRREVEEQTGQRLTHRKRGPRV